MFPTQFLRGLSRGFASILALVYFATNCALADAPASNLWAERRRTLARAQPLVAGLPAPAQAAVSALPAALPLSHQPSKNLNITSSQARPFEAILRALPPSAGTVRRITLPRGPVRRTVVHIQDVHRNTEAQTRIGQAVASLATQKQVGLVALEGAFGPVPVEPFRRTLTPLTLKKIADYLLKQHDISGPVHAALTAPTTSFFLGVDDPVHHAAHVDAYKLTVPLRDKVKNEIVGLQKDLAQKKERTFNSALSAFDNLAESYHAEKISLGDYISRLSVVAPLMGRREGSDSSDFDKGDPLQNRPINRSTAGITLFIQALSLEKSLNFAQVEKERGQLIEKLLARLTQSQTNMLLRQTAAYRAGDINHARFYDALQNLCATQNVRLADFPAMDAYIRYTLLTDQINAERLLQDIQTWEESAYARLVRTPGERVLIEQSKFLRLAGKLVDFSLTPQEWKQYQRLTPSPSPLPLGEGKIIAADTIFHDPHLAAPSSIHDISKDIPSPKGRGSREARGEGVFFDSLMSDFSSFESFYKEAQTRDQWMAENFLKAMDAQKTNTAVLVTGGFHAPGLEARLKNAGCAVISFVPRLTKAEGGGLAALSAFTQEKTPLEKLVAGEKLFLAGNPAQLAEVPALGGALEQDPRAFRNLYPEVADKNAPEISGVKIASKKQLKSLEANFKNGFSFKLEVSDFSDHIMVKRVMSLPIRVRLSRPWQHFQEHFSQLFELISGISGVPAAAPRPSATLPVFTPSAMVFAYTYLLTSGHMGSAMLAGFFTLIVSFVVAAASLMGGIWMANGGPDAAPPQGPSDDLDQRLARLREAVRARLQKLESDASAQRSGGVLTPAIGEHVWRPRSLPSAEYIPSNIYRIIRQAQREGIDLSETAMERLAAEPVAGWSPAQIRALHAGRAAGLDEAAALSSAPMNFAARLRTYPLGFLLKAAYQTVQRRPQDFGSWSVALKEAVWAETLTPDAKKDFHEFMGHFCAVTQHRALAIFEAAAIHSHYHYALRPESSPTVREKYEMRNGHQRRLLRAMESLLESPVPAEIVREATHTALGLREEGARDFDISAQWGLSLSIVKKLLARQALTTRERMALVGLQIAMSPEGGAVPAWNFSGDPRVSELKDALQKLRSEERAQRLEAVAWINARGLDVLIQGIFEARPETLTAPPFQAKLAMALGLSPMVFHHLLSMVQEIPSVDASRVSMAKASLDQAGLSPRQFAAFLLLFSKAALASHEIWRKEGPRNRSIFYRKYFEGRSHEEIGEELGLKESRVREILKQSMRYFGHQFQYGDLLIPFEMISGQRAVPMPLRILPTREYLDGYVRVSLERMEEYFSLNLASLALPHQTLLDLHRLNIHDIPELAKWSARRLREAGVPGVHLIERAMARRGLHLQKDATLRESGSVLVLAVLLASLAAEIGGWTVLAGVGVLLVSYGVLAVLLALTMIGTFFLLGGWQGRAVWFQATLLQHWQTLAFIAGSRHLLPALPLAAGLFIMGGLDVQGPEDGDTTSTDRPENATELDQQLTALRERVRAMRDSLESGLLAPPSVAALTPAAGELAWEPRKLPERFHLPYSIYRVIRQAQREGLDLSQVAMEGLAAQATDGWSPAQADAIAADRAAGLERAASLDAADMDLAPESKAYPLGFLLKAAYQVVQKQQHRYGSWALAVERAPWVRPLTDAEKSALQDLLASFCDLTLYPLTYLLAAAGWNNAYIHRLRSADADAGVFLQHERDMLNTMERLLGRPAPAHLAREVRHVITRWREQGRSVRDISLHMGLPLLLVRRLLASQKLAPQQIAYLMWAAENRLAAEPPPNQHQALRDDPLVRELKETLERLHSPDVSERGMAVALINQRTLDGWVREIFERHQAASRDPHFQRVLGETLGLTPAFFQGIGWIAEKIDFIDAPLVEENQAALRRGELSCEEFAALLLLFAKAALIFHEVWGGDSRNALVLRLRFFEGKTVREVGEGVETTHQNIHYLVSRALRLLRLPRHRRHLMAPLEMLKGLRPISTPLRVSDPSQYPDEGYTARRRPPRQFDLSLSISPVGWIWLRPSLLQAGIYNVADLKALTAEDIAMIEGYYTPRERGPGKPEPLNAFLEEMYGVRFPPSGQGENDLTTLKGLPPYTLVALKRLGIQNIPQVTRWSARALREAGVLGVHRLEEALVARRLSLRGEDTGSQGPALWAVALLSPLLLGLVPLDGGAFALAAAAVLTAYWALAGACVVLILIGRRVLTLVRQGLEQSNKPDLSGFKRYISEDWQPLVILAGFLIFRAAGVDSGLSDHGITAAFGAAVFAVTKKPNGGRKLFDDIRAIWQRNSAVLDPIQRLLKSLPPGARISGQVEQKPDGNYRVTVGLNNSPERVEIVFGSSEFRHVTYAHSTGEERAAKDHVTIVNPALRVGGSSAEILMVFQENFRCLSMIPKEWASLAGVAGEMAASGRWAEERKLFLGGEPVQGSPLPALMEREMAYNLWLSRIVYFEPLINELADNFHSLLFDLQNLSQKGLKGSRRTEQTGSLALWEREYLEHFKDRPWYRDQWRLIYPLLAKPNSAEAIQPVLPWRERISTMLAQDVAFLEALNERVAALRGLKDKGKDIRARFHATLQDQLRLTRAAQAYLSIPGPARWPSVNLYREVPVIRWGFGRNASMTRILSAEKFPQVHVSPPLFQAAMSRLIDGAIHSIAGTRAGLDGENAPVERPVIHFVLGSGANARPQVVVILPGQLTAEQLEIDPSTGLPKLFTYTRKTPNERVDRAASLPFAGRAFQSMDVGISVQNLSSVSEAQGYVKFALDLPFTRAAQPPTTTLYSLTGLLILFSLLSPGLQIGLRALLGSAVVGLIIWLGRKLWPRSGAQDRPAAFMAVTEKTHDEWVDTSKPWDDQVLKQEVQGLLDGIDQRLQGLEGYSPDLLQLLSEEADRLAALIRLARELQEENGPRYATVLRRLINLAKAKGREEQFEMLSQQFQKTSVKKMAPRLLAYRAMAKTGDREGIFKDFTNTVVTMDKDKMKALEAILVDLQKGLTELTQRDAFQRYEGSLFLWVLERNREGTIAPMVQVFDDTQAFSIHEPTDRDQLVEVPLGRLVLSAPVIKAIKERYGQSVGSGAVYYVSEGILPAVVDGGSRADHRVAGPPSAIENIVREKIRALLVEMKGRFRDLSGLSDQAFLMLATNSLQLRAMLAFIRGLRSPERGLYEEELGAWILALSLYRDDVIGQHIHNMKKEGEPTHLGIREIITRMFLSQLSHYEALQAGVLTFTPQELRDLESFLVEFQERLRRISLEDLKTRYPEGKIYRWFRGRYDLAEGWPKEWNVLNVYPDSRQDSDRLVEIPLEQVQLSGFVVDALLDVSGFKTQGNYSENDYITEGRLRVVMNAVGNTFYSLAGLLILSALGSAAWHAGGPAAVLSLLWPAILGLAVWAAKVVWTGGGLISQEARYFSGQISSVAIRAFVVALLALHTAWAPGVVQAAPQVLHGQEPTQRPSVETSQSRHMAMRRASWLRFLGNDLLGVLPFSKRKSVQALGKRRRLRLSRADDGDPGPLEARAQSLASEIYLGPAGAGQEAYDRAAVFAERVRMMGGTPTMVAAAWLSLLDRNTLLSQTHDPATRQHRAALDSPEVWDLLRRFHSVLELPYDPPRQGAVLKDRLSVQNHMELVLRTAGDYEAFTLVSDYFLVLLENNGGETDVSRGEAKRRVPMIREVLIPLAERLGLAKSTNVLRNALFRFDNPARHNELARWLSIETKGRSSTSAFLMRQNATLLKKLKGKFTDKEFIVRGRLKSLYSIASKIDTRKKYRSPKDINDLFGLMVILKEEETPQQLRTICDYFIELEDEWPGYKILDLEFPDPEEDREKGKAFQPYKPIQIKCVIDGLPFEIALINGPTHLKHYDTGRASSWKYNASKEPAVKDQIFDLPALELSGGSPALRVREALAGSPSWIYVYVTEPGVQTLSLLRLPAGAIALDAAAVGGFWEGGNLVVQEIKRDHGGRIQQDLGVNHVLEDGMVLQFAPVSARRPLPAVRPVSLRTKFYMQRPKGQSLKDALRRAEVGKLAVINNVPALRNLANRKSPIVGDVAATLGFKNESELYQALAVGGEFRNLILPALQRAAGRQLLVDKNWELDFNEEFVEKYGFEGADLRLEEILVRLESLLGIAPALELKTIEDLFEALGREDPALKLPMFLPSSKAPLQVSHEDRGNGEVDLVVADCKDRPGLLLPMLRAIFVWKGNIKRVQIDHDNRTIRFRLSRVTPHSLAGIEIMISQIPNPVISRREVKMTARDFTVENVSQDPGTYYRMVHALWELDHRIDIRGLEEQENDPSHVVFSLRFPPGLDGSIIQTLHGSKSAPGLGVAQPPSTVSSIFNSAFMLMPFSLGRSWQEGFPGGTLSADVASSPDIRIYAAAAVFFVAFLLAKFVLGLWLKKQRKGLTHNPWGQALVAVLLAAQAAGAEARPVILPTSVQAQIEDDLKRPLKHGLDRATARLIFEESAQRLHDPIFQRTVREALAGSSFEGDSAGQAQGRIVSLLGVRGKLEDVLKSHFQRNGLPPHLSLREIFSSREGKSSEAFLPWADVIYIDKPEQAQELKILLKSHIKDGTFRGRLLVRVVGSNLGAAVSQAMTDFAAFKGEGWQVETMDSQDLRLSELNIRCVNWLQNEAKNMRLRVVVPQGLALLEDVPPNPILARAVWVVFDALSAVPLTYQDWQLSHTLAQFVAQQA